MHVLNGLVLDKMTKAICVAGVFGSPSSVM